jgi:hypothetical protein
MQAPSPARIRFGINLPIGLNLNGNAWLISLGKGYRPGHAMRSWFRTFSRIRIACLGWLTVLLVALAVAGLVGTTWVRFARR